MPLGRGRDGHPPTPPAPVDPRTVLVTGSSGGVGRRIVPDLRAAGFVVRLLDLHHDGLDPHPDGLDRHDGPATFTGSITDPGLLREALAGCDAVLHLAGVSREAPWEDVVDANVHGTRTLLEACRDTGTRKVVLASSHHAAGMTPRAGVGPDGLPADAPFRPDTYYGWSKTAMESLGRLYADRAGLDVVAVRIGTISERPGNVRALATWFSPRDTVALVRAALDPAVTGYHCVWGISANTRRWWSLAAGEAIGYHPVDDAEVFAEQVLAAADPDEVVDLAGGAFTRFPLGEPN